MVIEKLWFNQRFVKKNKIPQKEAGDKTSKIYLLYVRGIGKTNTNFMFKGKRTYINNHGNNYSIIQKIVFGHLIGLQLKQEGLGGCPGTYPPKPDVQPVIKEPRKP